ncbi:hypothetical protein [Microbispora siamensis]|uniref:Uncharacterized protein n=1 Tax=Microbispora siamensis TaxID=564413 RepID=A0ABQ4GYT6_9ACTN|nr:hypothetical protein [Microbispora siamensis]GIH66612.1 hypothetical protein Msi02_74290 [Microbispora siamensis]
MGRVPIASAEDVDAAVRAVAVTVGADGFSYTRLGDVEHGFKLGEQL